MRRGGGALMIDEAGSGPGDGAPAGSSPPDDPGPGAEVDVADGPRRPPPLPTWLTVLGVAAVAVVCLLAGLTLGRLDPPGGSSVDVGFLQDMIDHHDQGVAMGLIVAAAGPDVDASVRRFAREVIVEQRWELGKMDAWLA